MSSGGTEAGQGCSGGEQGASQTAGLFHSHVHIFRLASVVASPSTATYSIVDSDSEFPSSLIGLLVSHSTAVTVSMTESEYTDYEETEAVSVCVQLQTGAMDEDVTATISLSTPPTSASECEIWL